jgi:error-prone DNA polymerase
MSMLPRLKPKEFYDLVIEVAIVRPGPIQGNMVHPYLKRRDNPNLVQYESPQLESVLKKTLGIPLFQEQAMRISMVCAGFSAGEADGLRRAMATFKRNGTIGKYRDKLINGMIANGYRREFAENIFSQLKGFADYGFPESHAASFAILAYVSSWLKCHYPAAFAAAILNAQPMGFYSSSRLVIDARDHGVDARPIDVNYSAWDHILEPAPGRHGRALRLGFRQIKGFSEQDAKRITAIRGERYASIRDLWRRTQLPVAVLERLARADAFGSFGLDRRTALWTIKGLNDGPLPLFDFGAATTPPGSNAPPAEIGGDEDDANLPRLTTGENILQDFRTNSLSLRPHALALLRPQLRELGLVTAKELADIRDGRRVKIGGLVQVRQRPGTASGVIFATLQDETGDSNVVIWPRVFDAFRREVLAGRMMIVEGRLQSESGVINVVADRIADGTPYLTNLGEIDWDNDFSEMLSSADEVKKPLRDPRAIREVLETFPDGRNFR